MGRMSDLAIDQQEQEDQYEPSMEEIIAANVHLALMSICTDVSKAPLDCVDLETLEAAAAILSQKIREKKHEDHK
jgi:hypothetical protein